MQNDCLNPYSVSKIGGEEFCKMYTDLFGLETVILRYFNVYGERQPLKGQYAPVIGIFLRQKGDGEPMTVIGDGTQRRDFTYVKDVVRANVLAADIDNKQASGETLNIGTGKSYSILDIARHLKGDYCFIEPRQGEIKESLASISKAQHILGWNPITNLKEWMETQQV
jgi:nucleoside-diphosphate-sugar epimerase